MRGITLRGTWLSTPNKMLHAHFLIIYISENSDSNTTYHNRDTHFSDIGNVVSLSRLGDSIHG